MEQMSYLKGRCIQCWVTPFQGAFTLSKSHCITNSRADCTAAEGVDISCTLSIARGVTNSRDWTIAEWLDSSWSARITNLHGLGGQQSDHLHDSLVSAALPEGLQAAGNGPCCAHIQRQSLHASAVTHIAKLMCMTRHRDNPRMPKSAVGTDCTGYVHNKTPMQTNVCWVPRNASVCWRIMI